MVGIATAEHLPGSLQAVPGAVGMAVGQVPPALHTHLLVPEQPAAPALPAARGAHLGQAEIAAVAGKGRAGDGGKRQEKRWKMVVGR